MRATLITIKCFLFSRPFQLCKQNGVEKCALAPHRNTHMWYRKNIRNGMHGETCYQYNLNMRMCKSSSRSINRLIVYKRHPSIHTHFCTSNTFLTASKINVFVLCCIVIVAVAVAIVISVIVKPLKEVQRSQASEENNDSFAH